MFVRLRVVKSVFLYQKVVVQLKRVCLAANPISAARKGNRI